MGLISRVSSRTYRDKNNMWYEILPAAGILIAVFKIHEVTQQMHARSLYRGRTDPRVPCDFQHDGGVGLDMSFQDMLQRDRMMTVDPFRFKFLDKQWRPISEIKKDYDPAQQS